MDDSHIHRLRAQIAATESQLLNLKTQLAAAEQALQAAKNLHSAYQGGFPAEWIDETFSVLGQDVWGDVSQKLRQEGKLDGAPSITVSDVAMPPRKWPLEEDEYRRYGRQMIMPEIGLHGQMRLKQAKVLVVGLGGLGCPAAAYLAGAGVGTLGLVDGDVVEVSNLHRQIAHNTEKVGLSKVESAVRYLQALNPLVNYVRHTAHLTPEQAIPLFSSYDLILDCTDHPTSRYLISDACVLTQKPLVSASALKTEGQLIVLNNPPRPPGDPSGGPCYRCIFPQPPPAESVVGCGEGGILGPVVGVMGVLQALEAIKVLTARPTQPVQDVSGNGSSAADLPRPTLLMFSAYNTPAFRSVRMRSRRGDCAACSAHASITAQSLTSGSLDYIAFCGLKAPGNGNLLPAHLRVSAAEFSRLPTDGSNVLIDVRDETQFAICALRGSINVPWTGDKETWLREAVQQGAIAQDGRERYVVCRLGNDSQLAAQAVLEGLGDGVRVKDIRGGFRAWREEVDASWPDY